MGLNHFMDVDTMAGYAEFKGLPAPRFSVIASGLVLVLGGLGVAAGAFPVLAAGALAAFLLISAVTMHDFWSIDDPEERQSEMTSFLKNVYGAGARARAAGRRRHRVAVRARSRAVLSRPQSF